MSRLLRNLVLLITLGAIANTLVAWACYLRFRALLGTPRIHPAPAVFEGNLIDVAEAAGATRLLWSTTFPMFPHAPGENFSEALGPRPPLPLESLPGWFTLPPLPISRGRAEWHLEDACGWPLTALVCEYTVSLDSSVSVSGAVVISDRDLVNLPADDLFAGWTPTALPIRPYWPGFVLNSLLFAAVIAAACALLRLRRRVRIRRGLCPACGYPAGTSEVCSECGRPPHSPARPAA